MSGMDVRHERHREICRVNHLIFKKCGDCLQFFFRCFDQELVVYLQDQAGFESFLLQAPAYAVQCALDNIRSRP